MRRCLVFSLLAFALAGCSDPTGSSAVAVIPTKSLYISGEIPSAQIVNRSEHNISFNGNALRVEKLQGTAWVLIGPEDLPNLLPLGLVIQARGAHTMTAVPKMGLGSGTYRLRFEFDSWGDRALRNSYSPEFRVEAGV